MVLGKTTRKCGAQRLENFETQINRQKQGYSLSQPLTGQYLEVCVRGKPTLICRLLEVRVHTDGMVYMPLKEGVGQWKNTRAAASYPDHRKTIPCGKCLCSKKEL